MRLPDIERTVPKILKNTGESCCLLGAPGIGKTSIAYHIAQNLGADLHIVHTAYDEPVDYKGIPIPVPLDGSSLSVMHWIAPDNLPLAEIIGDEGKPILFVFDDITQAHPQVMNAVARCFHSAERVLANRKVSKRVYFMATGNRVEDAAAAFEMPSFARMRVTFIDVEVNSEDWCEWAYKANDVPEEFISFLHPNNKVGGSKHIFDFDPARRTNCSPRTLHIAGKHWKALSDEHPHVVSEWLKGILCPAFDIEFRAHVQLYEKLPDIHAIMAGKEVKLDKVFKQPDVLFLTLSALVKRMQEKKNDTDAQKTLVNLAEFLKQIPKERADFAVWYFTQMRKTFPAFSALRQAMEWGQMNKELLIG